MRLNVQDVGKIHRVWLVTLQVDKVSRSAGGGLRVRADGGMIN